MKISVIVAGLRDIGAKTAIGFLAGYYLKHAP